MTTNFHTPTNKPTPAGDMLKSEFLEPLKVSQGQLVKAMRIGKVTPFGRSQGCLA